MENPDKMLLVDLMPILYRGYFVFLHKPRRTASGANTSALVLFANTIEQLIRTLKPTHVAIAFESRTPTFRHKLYPAYKAQREKMPEDVIAAIEQSIEVMTAWGIPMIQKDGFEADDIIGTLSTWGAEAGMEVVIASPDKDLGQLAGPKVSILHPGENKHLTADELCAQWEIDSPARMIDYLALAGDPSDNIPGAPGIGPKGARRLIRQYGTLEGVLAHREEIPGRAGESLRENQETLTLSKQLVTIVRDVPLDCTLESLRLQPLDLDRIGPVLHKYELNLVANHLGIATSTDQAHFHLTPDLIEAAKAKDASWQHLADVPHDYRLVDTAETREALAKELLTHPLVAFDTETTGLNPRTDRAVGCSFAVEEGRAWYLPLPEFPEEQREALKPFEPLFASETIAKVGHNLRFDRTVLRQLGIEMKGPCHDTLLEHYLLDAIDRHDLDHVANAYLNYAPIPITALLGKDKAKTMDQVPPEAVLDYAAEDADVAFRLHQVFLPLLREKHLEKLLTDCEEPLSVVLMKMEEVGIRLDLAALRRFRTELEGEIIRQELTLREYTGAGINLASPKQLGEFLFGTLAIDPKVKRTPRGQFPTNEETLMKVRDKHPIVDLILDWRACVKLKNTYVEKLPGHIDPRDGRIHTTFHQTFTDTGRLSSSEPNLQNIPVRSDRGQRIRAAFVARGPGWQLLSADYSQVELRLMAAISKDKHLIQAFLDGEDIHKQTASAVFGVPIEEVTPHQRSRCKMVNFGIIYGISSFGLANRLRIPRREAQELIDAYFAHYPDIKTYMEHTIATTRERGYAETLFGRRRSVPDINSRNATTRNAAERVAINMPIQGSAADIIKFAMVKIDQELTSRNLRTQMCVQIHDELLFDVPDEEAEIVMPLVKSTMEGIARLPVPLVANLGLGQDWLSAH